MQRLTERTGEGQAIPRVDVRANGHKRCMERLAQYEDLEEEGRLLELPFRLGDTVYRINKGAKVPVIAMTINEIRLFQAIGSKGISIKCVEDIYGGVQHYLIEDMGRTVFLTRKDAESANLS